MKVLKRNIILKKLIILFLMIFIPLIIICGASLISTNSKLVDETINSIHDKNNLFANNLDKEFRKITSSASTITVHSKVRKLSYTSQLMSNYERSQAVSQVREYISNIRESSDLIYNIRVYFRSLLRVYNTENYRYGSRQMITLDDYNKIIESKNNNISPVFYYNESLMSVIFSSFTNPANIIEVDYSIKQLSKRLKSQSMYDSSFYLFYINNSTLKLNNITDPSLLKQVLQADPSKSIVEIKTDSTKYEVFYSKLDYLDAYYVQIIPCDAFLKSYQLSSFYTIVFTTLLLLCLLIFTVGTIKLIHHPLTQLIHAFQAVEKGNLDIRINETEQSEFSYLYQGFNEMTAHLATVIDEVYNQHLLLQKAEFKQLQTQINPHFLYNSFFMLQRMMQNGMSEEASQVAKELGIYFKYITRSNSDYVLLGDEYQHAKIYSNIQSMRFEGRIETEFGDLPAAYENLKVPRLILQPIIENAYNYGLENKVNDGLLKVNFIPKDLGIEIVIEDNGNDLSDEVLQQINNNMDHSKNLGSSKEITGILNIYRRIQIFYNNSSTLYISRSNLGGMQVTIYLTEENGGDNT